MVGIIVPWNFPMTTASWGFAPALAAGNAVVLKPAELTPLTALRLGELALEAGLPEGLFQVVTGSGSVVGQRFVSHPDVRKVVFTGSTEVGTDVAAGCARMLKPDTEPEPVTTWDAAFGESRFECQGLAEPHRREGVVSFRGLEHHRVARGERRCRSPTTPWLSGKFPRDDDPDDAVHLSGT